MLDTGKIALLTNTALQGGGGGGDKKAGIASGFSPSFFDFHFLIPSLLPYIL